MPEAIVGQRRGHAIAAPGANTNIFTDNLTPVYSCSVFRVTVALTTASVFNVIMTDGTTSYTNGLNLSVALQAGDLYTFTFGVHNGNTYNFQVETDSVIRILQVDEVPGGVI